MNIAAGGQCVFYPQAVATAYTHTLGRSFITDTRTVVELAARSLASTAARLQTEAATLHDPCALFSRLQTRSLNVLAHSTELSVFSLALITPGENPTR